MLDVVSGMIIAGKYRLEAPLASGGMGSVWVARHVTLDTLVAVKFIDAPVRGRKAIRKRFEREAKAAAMLKSPHIVQIQDYGVENDLPYIVMELLVGEDLATRLNRKRRLPLAEITNIVTQVARALTRTARAGVIHRDLKPGNIFILRGDEDEELVKVLDFGIAKTLLPREDDDKTNTGAPIGSPRYMSPEQAQSSPSIDPRSDLWSLGVIAYRALTGEVPFQGEDVDDVIAKICAEDPVPPSWIVPELGLEMDAFFARALDRDPAGRFQTAREMAFAFATAAGERCSVPSFRLLTLPPPVPAALPPPEQATTRSEPGPTPLAPKLAGPAEGPRADLERERATVTDRAPAQPLPEPPPADRVQERVASDDPVSLLDVSEHTQTPSTGGVDIPWESTSSTLRSADVTPRTADALRRSVHLPLRRASLARVAVGACVAILLTCLILLALWKSAPSLTGAVASPGTPPVSAPPVEPPAPRGEPAEAAPPSASPASAVSLAPPASAAPPARTQPPRRAPATGTKPLKKNPILGI